MSNAFTLDAFRNEVIRRYAPTEIDLGDDNIVELRSMLKLGERDRKTVLAIIEEINSIEVDEDDDDGVSAWAELVSDACSRIFKLICSSPKKLLSQLDHEDPTIKANLHTGLLARWVSESQLGEARPSPA